MSENTQDEQIPLHKERRLDPEREKAFKAQQAKTKRLKDDLAQTFSTAAGQRSLMAIMELCGYQRSVTGGNASLGMDIMQGTLYNAARLNIYLELRALLPKELLKKVEFGEVNEIT